MNAQSLRVGRILGRRFAISSTAEAGSGTSPRATSSTAAAVGARPTPDSQWIATPPGVSAASRICSRNGARARGW